MMLITIHHSINGMHYEWDYKRIVSLPGLPRRGDTIDLGADDMDVEVDRAWWNLDDPTHGEVRLVAVYFDDLDDASALADVAALPGRPYCHDVRLQAGWTCELVPRRQS
jgi:hypothetical protein